MHVAAALDPIGGLPGVQEFPATAAGYASLLDWLGGFGTVALVGIEGTRSYGAGLARHMVVAGVRVVEVDRSDRQDRRRQGKSYPLDAVSAARAAQSGRARGAPKGRDGAVEAIRALMVAKRSARNERTQAINQARSLIVTGPDDLRERFARHTVAQLVTDLAARRPRPGDAPGYATRVALGSWAGAGGDWPQCSCAQPSRYPGRPRKRRRVAGHRRITARRRASRCRPGSRPPLSTPRRSSGPAPCLGARAELEWRRRTDRFVP
jgi:Transposase